MIKKALLFFVLLFVTYNLIVYFFNMSFYVPQNIQQDNLIRAQEYVYNSKEYSVVMVGSSLAAKIKPYNLPENYYNLAFRGMSIYDGLEIMKRSDANPKTILIELNIIDREPSSTFTEKLFQPFLYEARKIFPAMLDKNQPFCYAYSVALQFLKYVKPKTIAKFEKKLGIGKYHYQSYDSLLLTIKDRGSMESSFHTAILDEQLEEDKDSTYQRTISDRLVVLNDYIDHFRARGTEIVFFQMPVDKKLEGKPKKVYIEEVIQKKYISKGFKFIPAPNPDYFVTTDGVHLDDFSIDLFSSYLIDTLSVNIPGQLAKPYNL